MFSAHSHYIGLETRIWKQIHWEDLFLVNWSFKAAAGLNHMMSPRCNEARDEERRRRSAVSSSRRRRTGRWSSTAHSDQPSSSGPLTGCRTGEQWLLGILARRHPSYLQDGGGGGSSVMSCRLISHVYNLYTKWQIDLFSYSTWTSEALEKQRTNQS